MKTLFLSVVAVIALGVHGAHAHTAHLVMQSQPGDYIGGGKNYDLTYTSANSLIFAQVRRTLPSGEPAEIDFILTGIGAMPSTLLLIGTDQLGIPMQLGSYTNAQRADQ